MQVVPVIDLLGGQVVHARRGERDSYRPIASPLCAGSAPQDVVAGLLRLHAFRALYVADLDAIAGRGDHAAVLAALAARWPGLDLWVDAGVADLDAARSWLARGCHPVIGSESQRDLSVAAALAGEARALLSLDFRGEAFQGPAALLDRPEIWPARVIAMTLARVGAGAGPDLSRIQATVRHAGAASQVYAAGGVRHAADLRALAEAGAAGALVATALHDGSIGAAELRAGAA